MRELLRDREERKEEGAGETREKEGMGSEAGDMWGRREETSRKGKEGERRTAKKDSEEGNQKR